MFVSLRPLFAAFVVLLAAPSVQAQEREATDWDGLVEVTSERLDKALLRPGADFRPYQRLLLEPVTVAFREDWLRQVNVGTPLPARVTEQDAKQIARRTREIFADEFEQAFRVAGFALAESSADDVLRVKAGVIDLYLAAPEVDTPVRTRVYTMEPGEATLFPDRESRDQRSGSATVVPPLGGDFGAGIPHAQKCLARAPGSRVRSARGALKRGPKSAVKRPPGEARPVQASS